MAAATPLQAPRRGLAALLTGLLLLGLLLGPAPARGDVLTVVVLGPEGDDHLPAAAVGARTAASLLAGEDLEVEVAVVAAPSDAPRRALREVRRMRPLGVVAVVPGAAEGAWLEALGRLDRPAFLVASSPPSASRGEAGLLHLAPSPAAQAVAAADLLLAPLARRRVAVVHAPDERGRRLAAAFARNLSERIALAGVLPWTAADGAGRLATLATYEADALYVALDATDAAALAEGLEATDVRLPVLLADGLRLDGLLEAAPEAFAEAHALGGPDAELTGRLGERLVVALDAAGEPARPATVRAFEAVRRLLVARQAAGSDRTKDVLAALFEDPGGTGPLGPIAFEPHGGVRFPPITLWRAESGRLRAWLPGRLPTPGCGPPLGFGHPPPAAIGEDGRLVHVTYGEGDERTIEADLLAIGLSTDGAHPDFDAFVRDEVLHRAIRIAHRLFRREADGSPIPGWSWGISFTTEPADDDAPRQHTWLARVAGDHPNAGGQVIGSGLVAVYSTFLVRTMYASRRLDPPLSEADAPLIEGTYRWGEDRAANRRADEIRCLIDGYASAVGLTLAHELGHLCGCGHDTEHPTSIMNVVAGAGATWASAVWIPRHRAKVERTLGLMEAP